MRHQHVLGRGHGRVRAVRQAEQHQHAKAPRNPSRHTRKERRQVRMESVIELNGKKYALVEEDRLPNSFSTKVEAKIHAVIRASKHFSEEGTHISPSKVVGVMDNAVIMLIVAKDDQAKNVLCRYIYYEKESQKLPDLDFKTAEGTCKYGVKWIKFAMDLFNASDETDYPKVTMTMKKDYPITMENEHFKVILAPVIDNN